MEFPRFSTEVLLQRLRDIEHWLAKLGLKRNSFDRLHQITRLVQAVEKARSKSAPDQLPVIGEFDNYIYGLGEALELVQIHEPFAQLPRELIAPKMRRVVDGPFRIADELKGGSIGRNTTFELSLAAEWKLRGASVQIGEPDITLQIGETTFLVECKRPSKSHSVRANLRDARDQLASALDNAPKSTVGVIAISASRILTRGNSLFRAESERDVSLLSGELESFLNAYRQNWFSLRMDARIGAVLFHLRIPTDVGDHDHFALFSTLNGYTATDDGSQLEVLGREMDRWYATP